MRLELGSLEDQTAVITGGGSGVGAAVAVALAEAGADVYLIGRRLNKLELVAAKAREFKVNAAVQSVDISTSSGQFEAVQRIKAGLTHLDILVLNAATFAAASIEGADLSDFDRLYQTNVRAPYALTQALSPMLKARHGQVVFINSSSGIAAKPMTAQYDFLEARPQGDRRQLSCGDQPAWRSRAQRLSWANRNRNAGADISDGGKTLPAGAPVATRGCRIGYRQRSFVCHAPPR